VDDDTYVNIERTLEAIDTEKLPKKNTWFGKIKCGEGVNRDAGGEYAGKWYEPSYTAEAYPCYGGGGGNVLSSDLSNWVGENAHNFKVASANPV